MENLPAELIEYILSCDCLSIEDVVYFSSTCNFYRCTVNDSNKVWKAKLWSRWPSLKNVLFQNENSFGVKEVKYVYALRKQALELLKSMPPRFYKKYELSDLDLEEWGQISSERGGYQILVIYLMEIVNYHKPIDSIEVVPLNTIGNKTFQYYAAKVLRYIRQLHLTKVWYDYIALPPEKQILEIGAAFVAQWCQPHLEITVDEIRTELDRLAEQVKHSVRILYPNHSLLQVPQKELTRWRNEILTKNQYNIVESRELISVVRKVLFQDVGFRGRGNNEEYYMPQNSFMNEVLEKRQGLPITLAIVFEAVARRVGLRCDPISFPAHFLLRFCESYDVMMNHYYIDVFYGGQIVIKGACPHNRLSRKELLPVANATQVIERMANNLEVSARQHTHTNGRITRLRSSLELLKLVNPHDISAMVSLARLYMLQNMDTKPLEQFLLSQQYEVPEQAQRVVHMLRDYEAHHARNDTDGAVEAAQRTQNLKYAVGMVMAHQYLNYKCVIYDWDPVCLAAAEWQCNNNVDKLRFKDEQPFYNVLVEDGSHRYVAQENLKASMDMGYLFMNDEIGRHFSHFYKTHYVPNAEKEMEYPGDRTVRHSFHWQSQATAQSSST